MRDNNNKQFELFFARLFPSVILKNEIVSTILYVTSKRLQEVKNKVDKHLNTDI